MSGNATLPTNFRHDKRRDSISENGAYEEVPFIESDREPLLEVGASNLVSLDVRSCIEIGTVPQQDRSMRGRSCDHFRKTSLR